MTLILSLVAIALVLVFFEVLLPGGILGVLAAIAVLAATWVAAGEYGWIGGSLTFLGSVIACVLVTVVAFKVFSRTKYGRRFFLDEVVTGHAGAPEPEFSLIGKRGETQTRLNPSGMVRIDGNSYQAYSEDGFLEPAQPVEVVGKDSFKLIIKKL